MHSPLPHLRSVDNFRDIAGAGDGYPARGGRLRPRSVYRSNRLLPDEGDGRYLDSLGLVAVHDLRDAGEVERHPDRAPAEARWWHHEVAGADRRVVESLTSPEETTQMMVGIYRGFVADSRRRSGFASLLRTIAATDGPQLLHCAAGKDRTGWATWLLHHVAGVDEELALADYLLTDDYAAGSRTATLESIGAQHGADRAPVLEPAYRCDVRYLKAALAEVRRSYGSLDDYLISGLGVTARTAGVLRSRLVG
ncbi:tyrosine-protein phosphatase [Nocardioides sp. NPDC092400]|uniref:tyrosine-protein phosphatase n=1 Tax=Nocardioides sp. NPDC092400 TaxID=3155196 RepID=UPI00342A5C40